MVGAAAFAQEQGADLTPPPVDPSLAWAVELVKKITELPYIGHFLVLLGQWWIAVTTIMSAFIAFILVTLRTLIPLLNFAGLVSAAEKIDAFKSGKVMYWLKYFSAFFNAQKPQPK